MAEIGRFIRKTNLKVRVLSVVLVVAILCGSFVWFGNNDMDNVEASGTEKQYAEHIVDRIVGGIQSEFTVLEIVPYTGFGEFNYFVNDQKIIDAMEAKKTVISDNSWCSTTQTEWKIFEGSGFANFGYKIRRNTINNTFEIMGKDTFIKKAFGDQAGILAGKINVNTVEANDLTADMVNAADLIVFSSAPHDSGTVKLYEFWSGTAGHVFYNADGSVASDSTLYYDTYEQVGSSYVSRDMSWAACEALLDCTIKGRSMQLSNGTTVTLKTPVILDNTETSGLNQTSNVYKFNLVYRTLCGADSIDNTALINAYEALKTYLKSNAGISFGTTEIKDFFTSTYDGGSYAGKIVENCFDSSHNIWLTDYFFSYDGSALLFTANAEDASNKVYFKNTSNWTVPYAHYWDDGGSQKTTWPGVIMTHETGNIYSVVLPDYAEKIIFNIGSDSSQTSNLTIPGPGYIYSFDTKVWTEYETVPEETDYSSYKGVTARTGSSATIGDVMQFLLGTKSSQVTKYNYDTSDGPIKVLEVEPCVSYSYDTYEEVKALGQKLLMSGASSWTSGNYKNYLDVTCVTTNALNGMTDDLVSAYDIIIIGDNIDILNKDNYGKTIYNDRTLNGYVYLAFGDLFKIHTNALGILPYDYIELTNSAQKGNYVTLNSSSKRHYTEYLYNNLEHGKVYILKNMQTAYQGKDFGNEGAFYSDNRLGNVRGADNDITDITKEKLMQFAKSGKAIILADCLYNLDGYAVYPTSDMYDYCKTLSATDADGNRIYGVYSMDSMAGAVNHRVTKNPVIKMLEQPIEPTYSNGVIATFNNRDINFKFTLTGQTNATYRIKLYVDKNSDGVYKGIEEGISDDTNELYYSRDVKLTGGNTMEYYIDSQLSDNFIGMLAWKIEVVQLDAAGNETAFSNAVKGYSAVKNDDPKVVRVLQIKPDNNPYSPVRLDMNSNTSATNEFRDLLDAIESSVGYDVQVTVKTVSEYEAMFDPDQGGTSYNGAGSSGGYVYFYNSNSWSTPYAHYWSTGGSSTEWPGVKMTQVSGKTYAVWVPEGKDNIIFSNKGSNETATLSIGGNSSTAGTNRDTMYTYNTGGWSYKHYYENPSQTEPYDHLESFDMVVIGFADMFGASGVGYKANDQVTSDISNKYGAVDNITDFIDDGRAVLFTHDTVTWRVTPNYVTYGNYNDGAGDGRVYLWDSRMLYADGSPETRFEVGSGANKVNWTPYHDDAAHNITVGLRDRVGLDKYGITLNESNRDDNESPVYASSAMKPSYTTQSDSNGYYHVEELQGFTPWFIYRNNFLMNFYSDYSSDHNGRGIYSLKPFKSGVVSDTYFDFSRAGAWKTTKVEQLNEGCLTMYPYQITEELTIANTHGQYYSLNMEDDDVVVWYTLTGDGVSANKSDYYSLTEKDAENNYYIYSKNNITYSGAGHSDMSSVMEKKLFVNTVIKAIAGGNSEPVLTITNGAVGAGGTYMVYVNSANAAGDYNIDILGRDVDLVSPEAAGINTVVRESDLAGLKAAGVNVDVIGAFKSAKVYWNVDGTTMKLIKEYTESAPLRNGVISELKLKNTNLTDEELATIEKLVEGTATEPAMYAEFKIVISDWLGATSTVNVRLVKRDLFQLE